MLAEKQMLSEKSTAAVVQPRIAGNRRTNVISVTSGKGGVGKTSVVANLATVLGAQGKKVLLLDGDFGLANLDILFDLRAKATIADVVYRGAKIEDVLAEVAPNVHIIPSSSGVMEMVHLKDAEKFRLLNFMHELESRYDVLLIDTAAGISEDVTWLNASAERILVVVTPEPTSIADSYALMKVLHLKNKVNSFHLLVNQVKTEAEGLRVYQQISSVTDRFLNIQIDYVGHVLWDECISQAIRKRKPLVTAFPGAKSSKNFCSIADNLFKKEERRVAQGNVQFFWKNLLGHA